MKEYILQTFFQSHDINFGLIHGIWRQNFQK